MLDNSTQDSLAARVKALNLTPNRFAGAAGVAATTLVRGPRNIRTHRRIEKTLVAQELALLRHLTALHPQEALALATVALCPDKAVAA